MRAPRKALFIALILLVTILQSPLAIIPHAQAVIYFNNDFETFPTGWTTKTANGGTITKSNIEVHGGSWSCRVYTPVPIAQAYAYRPISEATGDHHLQFWIFVPTGQEPDDVSVVGTFDVGVDYSILVWLNYHDSEVYLIQPMGALDIGVLSTNEWHKIDGYFNDATNKNDWYIDQIFQVQLDTRGGGIANPDRIYVGDTSAATQSANDVYYIDDILVDDEPAPQLYIVRNEGIIASDSTVDDEQWFFLNASIEILTNSSIFLFNRIDIDPAGLNMSCSYTNSTDTFVEENDPNNYLQLDVVVSVKTDINNTFVRVDYYLRLHSNVTKDGVYNVTVYSTASGDLSDSDNYTSVFTLTIRTPSAPTLLFGAGFNGTSPYVELHWTHDMLIFTNFAVQNSTDKMSWGHRGTNTTREFTDETVVNGTERYYRVRACRYTGVGWKYSTWSDINFETVYFVAEVGEAEAADTIIMGGSGVFWIILIIIVPIVGYVLKKG